MRTIWSPAVYRPDYYWTKCVWMKIGEEKNTKSGNYKIRLLFFGRIMLSGGNSIGKVMNEQFLVLFQSGQETFKVEF